ncbi:MAG: hypothetical protein QM715_03950 [Nibricoccus sp.]
MLNSGKYQIATPGQSSRPMSLSEVNLGLASGEVMPDDQYWVKGMPRWEKVKDLPGVIVPATPKTRLANGSTNQTQLLEPRKDPNSPNRSAGTPGTLSFWAQPDHRPRISIWSPAMYFGLSVFFTPLMGSVLMAQNHRATSETVWRGISWFWIAVWTLAVVAALSLYFAAIPCGPLLYWGIGYVALFIGWCFTGAIPHRNFLNARTFEAAWRTDWGKPLGFGITAWIGIAAAFLLTR